MEMLMNSDDGASESPSLQPDMQPSTPDGAEHGVERPVCKCGAGPHPTIADICTKGHGLPGNQRTRKHEAPSLPVDASPIDLAEFAPAELAKRAAMILGRQMLEQEDILRKPLTRGQRRQERKILAALSAELREQMKEVERLEPFKRAASTSSILRRLSDDTLARVLHDVGEKRLEDVPEYDGPLTLRIELTDNPAAVQPPQAPSSARAAEARTEAPASSPAPSVSRAEELRALTNERIAKCDGGITGPVLAMGNRSPLLPAPAPDDWTGAYQVFEGRRYPVRPGHKVPFPHLPVENWRQDFPLLS